jgi:hypothetical protein
MGAVADREEGYVIVKVKKDNKLSYLIHLSLVSSRNDKLQFVDNLSISVYAKRRVGELKLI